MCLLRVGHGRVSKQNNTHVRRLRRRQAGTLYIAARRRTTSLLATHVQLRNVVGAELKGRGSCSALRRFSTHVS